MSSGIGIRLAESLRPEAEYQAAQEVNTLVLQEETARMWEEVQNALAEEIEEFNSHMPASQHLHGLYGGNSWSFTFGNRPTLTVGIGVCTIDLRSAGEHLAVLDMWYSGETLFFKGRSQNVGFETPVLTMDQTVEGMLKLAIGQDW